MTLENETPKPEDENQELDQKPEEQTAEEAAQADNEAMLDAIAASEAASKAAGEADLAEGEEYDDAPGDEVDPSERIEILEARLADANDKLLRAMAETENVRRRAQRDREDASKYAIRSFAEQMIPVADNLGRALQSVDADVRAATPAIENIIVGLEMVERELLGGFERAGIKAISALGQKFDPMKHEAMFELEDKEAIAGTIAQVLEVGYTLNDRTLRAAKVGITKGGPKLPPSGEETPAEADAQTKDGQTAYENKGAEPGSQINEEL